MNAQIVPQPEPSLLAGVNVLLEGPTGTGKTYSIGTLVDAGAETFYLGLENGFETLLGYYADRGKPIPENLHWHTMQVAIPGGYAAMAQGANSIGAMSQDALHKIQDFTRAQNNQFENVLKVMNDFQDHRTGQRFGAVDSWGPNRAIVIDGLTGLGAFALAMVTGKKPVRSQPDWGIAQDQVEKFLRYTCDGAKCHFILIAHIEREVDLVMGGSKITVSTLGRALPPKIPPMFSDVILCTRQGIKWQWSTSNTLCDLKTRSLPMSEDLPQDFKQILDKWRSRGGRFSSTVKV
jgi:AAA domain